MFFVPYARVASCDQRVLTDFVSDESVRLRLRLAVQSDRLRIQPLVGVGPTPTSRTGSGVGLDPVRLRHSRATRFLACRARDDCNLESGPDFRLVGPDPDRIIRSGSGSTLFLAARSQTNHPERSLRMRSGPHPDRNSVRTSVRLDSVRIRTARIPSGPNQKKCQSDRHRIRSRAWSDSDSRTGWSGPE